MVEVKKKKRLWKITNDKRRLLCWCSVYNRIEWFIENLLCHILFLSRSYFFILRVDLEHRWFFLPQVLANTKSILFPGCWSENNKKKKKWFENLHHNVSYYYDCVKVSNSGNLVTVRRNRSMDRIAFGWQSLSKDADR